jgi:imidazolonepropionase-like amidohydrolase
MLVSRPSCLVTIAALCLTTPVLRGVAQRPERNVPSGYAITNARIVTVSGPVIARGTVVIRNGLIAAVGATAAVPADAREIDGTGLTVYPGLIDAYTSLGIPAPRGPAGGAGRGGGGGGAGGAAAALLVGGAESATPANAPNSLYPAGLQPEVLALELIRAESDAFDAAHASGITTALVVPRDGIFMGQSALVDLAGESAQEMVLRSPVALHVGFTPLRNGGYPNSLMGVFSSLRQMLLDAQRYRDEQAAYAKNPRGMKRPENDPSLAALQPALAREMPVVFVAGSQREIERALDLAQEFNLRALIAEGNEASRVAARLKAQNVPVLVTLNFPRRTGPASPDADPEPIRMLRERVEAPKNAAALAAAGVRFAFTSGGMTNLTEFLPNVARAIESGLSPELAIRALTIQAAEILGIADRVGTIEPGKIANLTVVRGDITSRGARVVHLFVDGRPTVIRAPASGAGTGGGAGDGAVTAAGSWTLTVTTDEGEKTVTLTLQQESDRLRGEIQGALGTREIGNGSIGSNGEFRFTVPLTFTSETNEATFTGTLTGNAMRGTVTIVGHATGTFVGTRPDAGGEGGRGRRPPGE